MSTFAELYSDFQDQIKVYTEKVDVTPMLFMRYYTEGIQRFQMMTELRQKKDEIPYDSVNQCFYMPNECLRIVELKDVNNFTLVPQEYTQLTRYMELYEDGYFETPRVYSDRMPSYRDNQLARMYAIWDRKIVLSAFNATTDTKIYIWYIPDCVAITESSSQWNYKDLSGNDAGWYPQDTRFPIMFRNAMLYPDFAPYENLFLKYAIAEWMKSQGVGNYVIFEKWFNEGVAWAIINKPTYFTEGQRPYYMAPFS